MLSSPIIGFDVEQFTAMILHFSGSLIYCWINADKIINVILKDRVQRSSNCIQYSVFCCVSYWTEHCFEDHFVTVICDHANNYTFKREQNYAEWGRHNTPAKDTFFAEEVCGRHPVTFVWSARMHSNEKSRDTLTLLIIVSLTTKNKINLKKWEDTGLRFY